MQSVKTLLENASKGVCYPVTSIMHIFHHIEDLLNARSSFYQMMKLIEILHLLAIDADGRLLSSSVHAGKHSTVSSARLRKAQEYIAANYQNEIRLNDLAKMANMSPSSFSRFFKLRTGRSAPASTMSRTSTASSRRTKGIPPKNFARSTSATRS